MITGLLHRLRAWTLRDPGLALVIGSMILVAALYAPTLGKTTVNYDDPWLYQHNVVLQHPSWNSLVGIFTDLDPTSPLRFTLAPEYLPIRDLSVMLDFAIWGEHYECFHLTNVVLYLLAIGLVFKMLDAFGFDRTVCGLAVAIWAVHPIHAESVAWLSERKGLLGMVFAATTGFAYARFRAGGRIWWLVGAMLATVAAVWSKGPAAFTVATLAGLELVQPARRVSWRRSLVGLAAIGVVGVLAFVPVVLLALHANVVGSSVIPGNKIATVLGVDGFYLRLCAMAMPNAMSYPISSNGPSVIDIVLGVLGLSALIVPLVPRVRAPVELRAAAVIWAFAWLPVSHLVLPLHMIGVADRYALVLVLGVALAAATGIRRLPRTRMQVALVGVIAFAASLRTLDAQASWGNDLMLRERAVQSNPYDPTNWSAYAIALDDAGMRTEAERAIEVGFEYGESPRLWFWRGVFSLERGDRAEGVSAMRRAAEGGDSTAMSNLAQLLSGPGGNISEAMKWGRMGAVASPTSAMAHRSHGMAALAAGEPEEARAAFDKALAYESSTLNRFNLAMALLQLGRRAEAVPLLQQCVDDPKLGAKARAALQGSG